MDYVERWLLARYPEKEVFGGGLQVQTTLDPAIENDALAAVSAELVGTAAPLDMALAAVQPTTGFVEAIVGGRDFTEPLNQVNLALGGCDYGGTAPANVAVQRSATVASTCWTQPTVTGGGSGRQPGSSWMSVDAYRVHAVADPVDDAAAAEEQIKRLLDGPKPFVWPIGHRSPVAIGLAAWADTGGRAAAGGAATADDERAAAGTGTPSSRHGPHAPPTAGGGPPRSCSAARCTSRCPRAGSRRPTSARSACRCSDCTEPSTRSACSARPASSMPRRRRAELVSIADGRHDAFNDITHRTAAATIVLFLERLRAGAALPLIAVPEQL